MWHSFSQFEYPKPTVRVIISLSSRRRRRRREEEMSKPTLAVVSQEPEAKIFGSVFETAQLMTSEVCSVKIEIGRFFCISQTLHVLSPEEVTT
jgi:hypothetical protein